MDDVSEVVGSVVIYSMLFGSLNIKDVIKYWLRDLVEKLFEIIFYDNVDIKVYVYELLFNCLLICICFV